MANKLFLVSATLALFFLLANASIYRTVVEFEEDDSTNPKGPRPQQECQKEFKEAEHLQSCQQWINKQVMQSGGGPNLGYFENSEGSQKMHPLLKKCCNELEEEEPVCVCPTLKKAAKAVRLQGQHGPFEKIKIYRVAKNLPEVCSIPQVDACPFKAIPFFPPYY